MTEDTTALEIAMAMAMEEEPMAANVDEEVLEAVKTTLTSWVMSTFVEEQEAKEEVIVGGDPEDSSESDLTALIENAIACAYVFARITEDVPTEASTHHPTGFALSAEIVESLLREGTVTLSIVVNR